MMNNQMYEPVKKLRDRISTIGLLLRSIGKIITDTI